MNYSTDHIEIEAKTTLPTYATYENAVKAATKAIPEGVRWVIVATAGGRFSPAIIITPAVAQKHGLLFTKFLKIGSC